VGILLAAFSGVGLLLSFGMLLRSPAFALLMLVWALLGFTPLWTGVTYLEEARALTREQTAIMAPTSDSMART